MQQGRLAAANIEALLNGYPAKPFHYFDKGSMATIGKARAVAQVFPTIFKHLHLTGLMAWFAWLFVHLTFLIGFRNKVGVVFRKSAQAEACEKELKIQSHCCLRRSCLWTADAGRCCGRVSRPQRPCYAMPVFSTTGPGCSCRGQTAAALSAASASQPCRA
jgi:hypothetical protein